MATITVSDDTTSHTYDQLSLTKTEGIYRDVASTIANPQTIRVSHEITTNATGVDRHLVQLSRVDDDAADVPYQGSVHVVIAAPREGVTAANLELEWNKLRNLIDAKFDEIYGGFQPVD